LRPVVSLLLLALAFVGANAQNLSASKDAPPFHEHKGVHLGITTDEARKVPGKPVDEQPR
jgi:hypothetical protein